MIDSALPAAPLQPDYQALWASLYAYVNRRCDEPGDPASIREAWILRDRMHALTDGLGEATNGRRRGPV